MDKKIERQRGAYRYHPRPEMRIADVIRSIKECADEIERLALRVRKKIAHQSTQQW